MRVLVVDDDAQRAESLAKYLSANHGHGSTSVEIVGCIDHAKVALRSRYFDAMVIDVVLPKRLGEKVSSANSLALLDQLSRQSFLKKPEKVIAITAHDDEIESFRANFEEFCTAVVRANEPSDAWRRRISNAIQYTSSSQLSREASKRDVAVLTIHGIRTYGAWQERLRALVEARTDEVKFYTYKYGYFSALSFMVPALRDLEVKRLYRRLVDIAGDLDQGRIIVFAHSFGTYLAARTLKKALSGGPLTAEVCLVCCGSVLSENFDWGFARRHPNVRVINDCGDRDYILYLSKSIALGLGMAGKVGFNGFNDSRFVNRWFNGGHSHYFDGDSFMLENWLPLLVKNDVPCVDRRVVPTSLAVAMDSFVSVLGRLKPAMYVTAIAMIGVVAWGLV